MTRIIISLFFLLFFGSAVAQQTLVSSVKIEGAKRNKTSFLEKLMTLKPGMALDSVVMAEDMERLKRLPSVAYAHYQVLRSVDDRVEVVYNIEENFTLIPYANVYTTNNDEVAFLLGLQEFNLLGRGITLGGFYQYNIYNSFGVQITAPYLFGNKIGIDFNYKDLTTREPVFFNNSTADYRYNNHGFEILGLYEFDFRNRVALGFGLFTEGYDYLTGAVSPKVPQQFEVDKHLYKLIYNFDNVRYFYQYLDGFRSTLNLQYVGSSQEGIREFLIGFNDFVYFRRVGKRGNWATRMRIGIATNRDTPFAPFTVDNNLNIRGVGHSIDRGTGTIVLNTEYRHTLIDKDWFVLQGNVFIDGGTWRLPGGDFNDFWNKENIRVYPGIGLRFIHKRIFNAIFRIDYGYGITPDASRGFVFGIGQYF